MSLVGQETPCILWNPEVHYRIHNSPHPTSSCRFNLILSAHLRLVLASCLYPSGFCNPEVHYRIHNRPLPVPTPDQSSPCLHATSSWRSNLILSSHLRLILASGLYPQVKHAALNAQYSLLSMHGLFWCSSLGKGKTLSVLRNVRTGSGGHLPTH